MRASRRYVVLGAGGVGSALGGALARAGAEVVLCARGAQLAALRRDGLTFATPTTRVTLALPVVPTPRDIAFEPRDVVLACVKSQDWEDALDELRAAAPRDIALVCAQNGVANEARAARAFERVYGLVVFSPIELAAPGHVSVHCEPSLGALDLGRHPSGTDALVAACVADLVAAGFDARAEAHILRWKYGKLLTNLGNAVQALAGSAALEHPLYAALCDEARACLEAAGIAFASAAEMRARFGAIREVAVGGALRSGGSSWQSLARRSGSIETDFLNGEIVRIGAARGAPAPLNAALTALALRAAREGWPPGRLRPEELAASLVHP